MSNEDKTPAKPTRPAQWEAKGEVTTLIILGLILAVVGGVVAYAAWPAQEISAGVFEDAGVEETGSIAWALIGAVVALIGQVIAAIGIIAAGVRLGSRN